MMRRPANLGDRLGRSCLLVLGAATLVFMLAPVVVVVPLSFNSGPYFTFSEGLLQLSPDAFSLRWYRGILEDGRWSRALANSLVIGLPATAVATALGTLAALGLASPAMPKRELTMGLLISPLIVPLMISVTGMSFFYGLIGLTETHLGLILTHAALGAPFVVITVTATLSNFNPNLARAAASLGASPLVVFREVQLPLIAPGVATGALLAFATSFDEVVTVLYLGGVHQHTIPRELWAGIREQPSPEVMAVASLLFGLALLLFAAVEWLRRKGDES